MMRSGGTGQYPQPDRVSAEERRREKMEAVQRALSASAGRGIPNPVLAGLRPTFDGCRTLKLTISPDVIKSVFREFPYVERMYNACVPVKCSEKAFWTAFVQSEYFYKISHRGGQEVRTESTESTDIFNDYPNESKVDVFLSPTVVRPRVLGPLDTLARDAEPVVAGAVPEVVTAVPSARKTAVDTIMRKYNRHSATILGAAAAVQRTLRPAAAAPGAAPANDVPLLAPLPAELSVDRSVFMQDLAQASSAPALVPIPLDAPGVYFRSNSNSTSTSSSGGAASTGDEGGSDAKDVAAFIRPQAAPCCGAETFCPAASQGLTQFMCGVAQAFERERAATAAAAAGQDGAQQPRSVVSDKEIRPLFHNAVELSRHLWSCYPLRRKQSTRRVRELLRFIEHERAALLDRMAVAEDDTQQHHYKAILRILDRAISKASDTTASQD